MPCACSRNKTPVNKTPVVSEKKNIIPIIQKDPKKDEIQKLKNYIKNHPRKNEDRFKVSMSIILQEILKSFR